MKPDQIDDDLHTAWRSAMLDLCKSYRFASDGEDVRDTWRDLMAHLDNQPASMTELTDPELRAGIELQRKEIDRLKMHLRDEGDRIAELRAQVAELDHELEDARDALSAAYMCGLHDGRKFAPQPAPEPAAQARLSFQAIEECYPDDDAFEHVPAQAMYEFARAVERRVRGRPVPEPAAAVIADMRHFDPFNAANYQLITHWADRLERAQWPARDAASERQRCLSIIRAYQVPAGNSAAGELAAEWAMAALREVCAEIEAGAPLAGPAQDVARDAERYRWLLRNGLQRAWVELGTDIDGDNFAQFKCSFRVPEPPNLPYEDDEGLEWKDSDFDAAIDAALAASKGAEQ